MTDVLSLFALFLCIYSIDTSKLEKCHKVASMAKKWQKYQTLTVLFFYFQLDVNNAHIMTDVLSSFALSGDSASAGQAGKSLQLAAFAQEGAHRGPDLTVRVYVLPDNAAALAQVTESERRYNGRLLDKPMSFLFKVRF